MGQGEYLGNEHNLRFSLDQSRIWAQAEFELILGKVEIQPLNYTLLSELRNMKNGHGHSPIPVFDFW